MNKKLQLFILLFLTSIPFCFAQFVTVSNNLDEHDFWNLTYQFTTSDRDEVLVKERYFGTVPHKSIESIDYSFNDYYYEVEFNIYNVVNGEYSLLKSKTVNPSTYQFENQYEKGYSALFNSLSSYKTLLVEVRLKKYVYNNDTSMGIYFLRNIWKDSKWTCTGGNCEDVSTYYDIKYRGENKSEAILSKCDNDTENIVGINIIDKYPLHKEEIYSIDRGTGIGARYYEIISVGYNPTNSANTIFSDNVGSSFYANCSGLPDLTIDTDRTNVTSDCGIDCPITLGDLGSKKHLFNTPSSILSIGAYVKNIGTSISPNTNISYYLSRGTTILSTDFKFYQTTTVSSLVANAGSEFTGAISASDFPSGSSGDYNIIVQIDLPDVNQSNNIAIIPIEYNTTKSQVQQVKLQTNNGYFYIKYNNTKASGNYNTLKIYNSNTSYLEFLKNVLPDETVNISPLPTGTYAVHMDGAYIKQIYVDNSSGDIPPPHQPLRIE